MIHVIHKKQYDINYIKELHCKNIYQEFHFHAFSKISYSANISITIFRTIRYYSNFIQLMKGLTKILLHVKGTKNSTASRYSFISEIHIDSWLSENHLDSLNEKWELHSSFFPYTSYGSMNESTVTAREHVFQLPSIAYWVSKCNLSLQM